MLTAHMLLHAGGRPGTRLASAVAVLQLPTFDVRSVNYFHAFAALARRPRSLRISWEEGGMPRQSLLCFS